MILNTPQPLGELALLKVYFDHDGPRLYSVSRPQDDAVFLAMCVDEGNAELRYLYWSVTAEELRFVERGEAPLRDSLFQSDQAFLVVEDYTDDQPSLTVDSYGAAAEIPEKYLPIADARLSELRAPVPTEILQPSDGMPQAVESDLSENVAPIQPPTRDYRFLGAFSMDELNSAALNDHHFYAAIEMQNQSVPLGGESAVNLSGLASIASSTQELLYAIGNESQGFVRTGETVRSALDMSVYGARAASFVLILRTPEQGMLFDGEVSRRALRGLTWILKCARSEGEIVEELRKRSYQVRRRVRDLLTDVTEANSALTALVTDGSEATWGRVTHAEAANALNAIKAVSPTLTTVSLRNVLLTALNLTRRTFEVWDQATGRRHSGNLSEDVLDQVDGLTVSQSEQFYDVEMETETDFARDKVGPASRNRLLAISLARDEA